MQLFTSAQALIHTFIFRNVSFMTSTQFHINKLAASLCPEERIQMKVKPFEESFKSSDSK